MAPDHDDDGNELKPGSMPDFIPKDAPEMKPREAQGEADTKDPGSTRRAEPVTRETLADGTSVETWYAGEHIHRDGAPALIKVFPDGTREEQWFQNGKLHRENGPAVTRADGTQERWINGERRIELEDVVLPEKARATSTADARASTPTAPGDNAPDDGQALPEGVVDPELIKALLAAAQAAAPQQPQSHPSPGAGMSGVAASSAPTAAGEGAQAAQSGLRNLAEGGLGLVGGVAALAGAVGRGIGNAARGIASDVEARRQARLGATEGTPRVAPGISVLPKISQYRVEQAEKMANAYESSLTKFWSSGKLPDVRRAIEEHASQTGANVADVMAKMVPGGELEGLRTQFIEAVGESQDAQESKKGMDRALESWIRQYGRGSEELLNLETGQNPDYDDMRMRFEGTREKMEGLVTQSPVFAGEQKSHAERFREAIERIALKIREMLEGVAEFLRGRNAEPEQDRGADYEP
ncbi:hypothetical protein [Bordetella flabilis]|uniref:Uncharacterized protein n=1 Tax=Bordetella flabilis TaxID=463014 RepID=A0A193GMQ0_9BORD|nr:hypothetical protein [Bordetella flabilis]ANN80888.1 hypothetical protein BAU07_26570 [Bordetella flabilis]